MFVITLFRSRLVRSDPTASLRSSVLLGSPLKSPACQTHIIRHHLYNYVIHHNLALATLWNCAKHLNFPWKGYNICFSWFKWLLSHFKSAICYNKVLLFFVITLDKLHVCWPMNRTSESSVLTQLVFKSNGNVIPDVVYLLTGEDLGAMITECNTIKAVFCKISAGLRKRKRHLDLS